MFTRNNCGRFGRAIGGALLVAILFVGVTAVAQGQPEVAFYADGQTMMIYWDPSESYSHEVAVMQNMYELLMYYDAETGGFTPGLARSWDKSDDGLVWTFHLQEGVKFHTGRPLTADSVKRAFERTIDMGEGPSYIWGDPVDHFEVVDDLTLRIYLNYPTSLDILASGAYGSYVFDPDAADTDWFNQGNECGTAAYMLESSQGTTEVVLTRFEDYWRGWEGKHFDKIIFKTVAESSTRRLMLESGEADYTNEMPIPDVEAMRANPDVEIARNPSWENQVVMFNTAKSPEHPISNPLVRKALAYTLPYKDAVEGIMFGNAQQSRGVVPYALWGSSDRVKQYTLSPETAKVLLTAAGYPDGGFSLVLTYGSGDTVVRSIAELWKEQLANLGVELKLQAMPFDSMIANARAENPNDRQDIFFFDWFPDNADPMSFLFSLFAAADPPILNMSYYDSPVFEALIDRALKISATNLEEAINLYVEAQNILMEECVGLAIFDRDYLQVKRTSLKGYVGSPCYAHVVFWYNCYREE